MANIANELAAINSAVYGNEVRSSISGAIQKINAETEDAISRQILQADDTLSITGKAADAKVVGDCIRNTTAQVFDSSNTYEIGDYVLKDLKLYRRKTVPASIDIGTQWVSSEWTLVTFADEIQKLCHLDSVDTNTYSENNKHDMADVIEAILAETGYCKLGEGIFYVSRAISMPEGSCLEGSGFNTIIRLLQSESASATISMTSFCTIRNLRVSGGYSKAVVTNEGTRNGIHFVANKDGSAGESTVSKQCFISDVFVENFTGSGILCHNTSRNYAEGLYGVNIGIRQCHVGLNIDYVSEYNKFSNLGAYDCFIGCVNNGGNNVFSCCTFQGKDIGFYMDGSKTNSGHGTITGCTFNHIGNNSDSYGIYIKNMSNGFLISDSHFWYSNIYVKNSNGIVFADDVFGCSADNVGIEITVEYGKLVYFNGCVFHEDDVNQPIITITGNDKVRFNQCYGTGTGQLIDETAFSMN